MNPINMVVTLVTNPNSRYNRRLVTAEREHASPAAERGGCSQVGRTVDVPGKQLQVRELGIFFSGLQQYRVTSTLI